MNGKETLAKHCRTAAATLEQIAVMIDNGHVNEIGSLGAVHIATGALVDDMTKTVTHIYSHPTLFSI